MPAPATVIELLEIVAKSGLLKQQMIDRYFRNFSQASPTTQIQGLLQHLIDNRAITAFHATHLFTGRYKGFFLGGKYKLLAHLGSGGMGEVYLAEQLLLDRLVAIKILKLTNNKNDSAGATQRFFREARAVAALQHPNIAQLFDVSSSGPNPYMVMEYVDGTNMHAVVSEHQPLSVTRAVNYTVQSSRGLEHAHQNGLVHRDVKPGNLIVDRQGIVKVLDLGMARYHSDSSKNGNLTAKYDDNNLIGTADFMSPEQTNNSSAVDERADVYSLGCTLYYLLTGRAPFEDGTIAQKLLWHQVKSPLSLDMFRQDIPQALSRVVDQMMAKDRDRRYQSMTEVRQVLTPWYTATIPAPPASEMPEQIIDQYDLGLVDVAPVFESTPRINKHANRHSSDNMPGTDPLSSGNILSTDSQVAKAILHRMPYSDIAEKTGLSHRHDTEDRPDYLRISSDTTQSRINRTQPTEQPSATSRRPFTRVAIFIVVQLVLLGATIIITTYLNNMANKGLVTPPLIVQQSEKVETPPPPDL
jgi:eukaryotic-like serine/threonine-protein kinase